MMALAPPPGEGTRPMSVKLSRERQGGTREKLENPEMDHPTSG